MKFERDVYETTTAGGTLAVYPERYTADDGTDIVAWFDVSPRSRRFDLVHVTRDDADTLEWEDSEERHQFLRPLTSARARELAPRFGYPVDLAGFKAAALRAVKSA